MRFGRERGKPKWSHARFGAEFNVRWKDLTDFNAERRRGILHDPKWVAKMEAKQRRYDEVSRSGDKWAIWTCEMDGIPSSEVMKEIYG